MYNSIISIIRIKRTIRERIYLFRFTSKAVIFVRVSTVMSAQLIKPLDPYRVIKFVNVSYSLASCFGDITIIVN